MKVNDEVIQLIADFNNYVKNIPLGCLELSINIKKGNIDEAIKQIVHFAEGISWLIYAKDNLSAYNIFIEFERDDLEIMLNEINEALELQDFTLVADIFEYGIKEFFESIEPVSTEN